MYACLPKLQRCLVKKRFLTRKKAGFGMTVAFPSTKACYPDLATGERGVSPNLAEQS